VTSVTELQSSLSILYQKWFSIKRELNAQWNHPNSGIRNRFLINSNMKTAAVQYVTKLLLKMFGSRRTQWNEVICWYALMNFIRNTNTCDLTAQSTILPSYNNGEQQNYLYGFHTCCVSIQIYFIGLPSTQQFNKWQKC
jgi:hypothetical protein